MEQYKSDFLKKAQKMGRIKELEDAFEQYPPEKEWHQGRIENVLKETQESYYHYEIGDIVFVSNYIYPNGAEGRNHLFVIIEKENIAVSIEYFAMILSSQIRKERYKYNIRINKNKENNLNRDSIVKTDYLYKINGDNILFKIGSVEKSQVDLYKKNFIEQE